MGRLALLVAAAVLACTTALARGGGGCFPGETPVLLAGGGARPIAEVRPGDRVLGFTEAGEPVTAEVRRVYSLEVGEVFEVLTEGGVALRATAEHPCYAGEGRFRTVAELGPGDPIFTFGAGLRADRVRTVRRVYERTFVHNLETDRPNTFVAGGIAVHNKGGGGGGCFAAGTPVAVPGGTRPIEALAPGDIVLSGGGTPVRVRIAAIARDEVVEVETSGGARLATTREHPLLLARGRFRAVEDLGRGSFLRRQGGGVERVVSVRPTGEVALVHEIEVDPPHTYVAGGFVVHNKGGGGGFRSSRSYGGGGGHGRPMTRGEAIFFGAVLSVFFVAVVVAAIRNSGASAGQGFELDYCYPRPEIEKKARKTRKLIDTISKNDADFTATRLEHVAHGAFMTLQHVWEKRDYTEMAPLVFPDLARDHQAQIQSMIRNHEINIMGALAVDFVEVVHLRYTERKEDRQFTALIQARARDYYVDDRTRKKIRGDDEIGKFQELWTFQLLQGKWLLREIEQTRESSALRDENFVEFLTPQQLADVYGATVAGQAGAAGPWVEGGELERRRKIHRMLNFLVETDKVWSEEEMLETARQAAIAYYTALERRDLAGLHALATPDAVAALMAEIRDMDGRGETVEFRNLCVRKVEIALVRNRAESGRDEFVARVRAHAQRVRASKHGTQRDPDVRRFTAYVLMRRDGERFKLAAVLPPEEGDAAARQENIDEESSPEQLQWYYTKERTI